ncbi:RNA polymerase sigma factor [Mucilaginibacter sp. AW1-3]
MKSTVQGQTDAGLLALLQNGDRQALELIYFRYADFLFGFAIKRLNCTDTAADMIQELFLKLWIKRGTLNVKGELQAYLTFCLKNLIIDHYSHQLVKSKYLTITNPDEVDNYTIDLLNYNDTRRTLQTGINALPQKMRQVFHLNKIEDYSIDEIADELNLSRQTVKNQLVTAVKRLRVSLGAFLTVLYLFSFFQK